MISRRALSLAIICTTILLCSTTGFALVQQSNGTAAMGWQIVPLPNKLPSHPLAIAASTNAIACDFVAVASDSTTKTYSFYLLDHANLILGWQKKQPFLGADASNLQYGLGRFVAMGTDHSSGKPVIATSSDNGKTWAQSLVFGGKGHYDNAAFSQKMGVMTGKDGAIAITTDGINWVETTPPSGISRKVIYTNIAPSGAPIDNQFQLCFALPPGQSTLCGFLLFQDIPILGSLISADGKNWSYSIPYSILRNQLLIYQNKTFLVNDTLSGISYAYHDSTTLGDPNFSGLQIEDPLLPLINIFQCASYQQNWVAVGYEAKTGTPLSLFSDSRVLNNNFVFSTDLFPQPVRLVTANQAGFLAIGDDGTSYYSTSAIPITPSPAK